MTEEFQIVGPTDDDEARRIALEEGERRAAVGETEDFDAFWSEQGRQGARLSNVFGVDVELPPAMTLQFEVEARRVATSSSEADTRRMVSVLFGPDALQRWTERGMDLEQFAVLLLWGSANCRNPNSMTLAEARRIYLDRTADKGKAQGTAQTRSGAESSATGPSSKPTSRGSTGSRKRRSRR